MGRKRGNILVMVFAALLIIFVFAVGYFYWLGRNPISSFSIDDVKECNFNVALGNAPATWKTYQISSGSYNFKAPPEWRVRFEDHQLPDRAASNVYVNLPQGSKDIDTSVFFHYPIIANKQFNESYLDFIAGDLYKGGGVKAIAEMTIKTGRIKPQTGILQQKLCYSTLNNHNAVVYYSAAQDYAPALKDSPRGLAILRARWIGGITEYLYIEGNNGDIIFLSAHWPTNDPGLQEKIKTIVGSINFEN